MKILLKYIINAGAAILFAPMAVAGLSQPADVDVDLNNNFAHGDMVSARYADGKGVFIGCGIRNFDFDDGTVYEYGFCQAEDAEGEHVICSTESPILLNAMKSLSDYSFVTFSFNVEIDDAGNEITRCTRVGISTQSFYVPNIKVKKN